MVNRKYKDRLFRLIFGDDRYKDNQLSLYNALNNTSYNDVSKLETMTIEDCIYMGMKNDVALLIEFVMGLYEHQSTLNPNMPARGLFYFSDLYQKYIAKNRLNLYGSSLIKLPTPQYVVFYNGNDGTDDEVKYKLSDAFGDTSVSDEFEWTATLKNINLGKNKELMEKCNILKEYAILIDKIKRYTKEMSDIEKAIDRAVEECIDEGVLKDFLIAHRAEVKDVCLTEYNEQEVLAAFKEEAKEEGIKEGIKEGEERVTYLYKILLDANRLDDLRRSMSDKEYRKLMMSELLDNI